MHLLDLYVSNHFLFLGINHINDIKNEKLQQSNYASSNGHGDDRNEHLFVIQHMVNPMTKNATDCQNVWLIDLGASSHMASHGEWFSDVKILEKPNYLETSDDIVHPIAQVSKV